MGNDSIIAFGTREQLRKYLGIFLPSSGTAAGRWSSSCFRGDFASQSARILAPSPSKLAKTAHGSLRGSTAVCKGGDIPAPIPLSPCLVFHPIHSPSLVYEHLFLPSFPCSPYLPPQSPHIFPPSTPFCPCYCAISQWWRWDNSNPVSEK